ncbi:MAG: ABC transporter permease [Planctomycetota bacterium]
MTPLQLTTIILEIVRRAWRRLLRQPARLVGAIGTPLLLWLLIASGAARSFTPVGFDEVGYEAFMLPGIMTLITVFACIFSSITIIEDRNEGWLQALTVSPAPRWTIAVGSIAGGATVGALQALVLLPAAPLIGLALTPQGIVAATAAVACTAIAMTALGLAFAWRCESSAGFHGVMNIVLMPMWLLSSAMFPIDGASAWIRAVMQLNPLTWCTEAIRAPLLGGEWLTSLVLSAGFAVAMIVIATAVIARRPKA